MTTQITPTAGPRRVADPQGFRYTESGLTYQAPPGHTIADVASVGYFVKLWDKVRTGAMIKCEFTDPPADVDGVRVTGVTHFALVGIRELEDGRIDAQVVASTAPTTGLNAVREEQSKGSFPLSKLHRAQVLGKKRDQYRETLSELIEIRRRNSGPYAIRFAWNSRDPESHARRDGPNHYTIFGDCPGEPYYSEVMERLAGAVERELDRMIVETSAEIADTGVDVDA